MLQGVCILSPDFKPDSIGVAVRGSEVHSLHRHLEFSDQILRLDLVGIWESLGGFPCRREDANVEVVITLPI